MSYCFLPNLLSRFVNEEEPPCEEDEISTAQGVIHQANLQYRIGERRKKRKSEQEQQSGNYGEGESY